MFTRLQYALQFVLAAVIGSSLSAGCVSRLDEWGNGSTHASGEDVLGVEAGGEPIPPLPTLAPSPGAQPGVVPVHCGNERLDEDETGIDCGGGSCFPCAVAWSCRVDRDCESQVCNGVCLVLTCGNGVADDAETGPDCGGPCAPCDDGAACYTSQDCESGNCSLGHCLASDCNDGVQNGSEVDVDCGGNDCYACLSGGRCDVPEDCVTGVCADHLCVEEGCADGLVNGAETDVDCGGPDCAPCASDRRCSNPEDCSSGVCVLISSDVYRCSDARCDDGVNNGWETDVDCGGLACPACADGAECQTRIDCASLVCDRGTHTCSPAACDDAAKNGSESDVDCGGVCAPCSDGADCASDADCVSGSCLDSQCRAATCSDGRTNGSESDLDCGGACPGCGLGESCSSELDCRSAACLEGACEPGFAGRPCAGNEECASGACIDGACARSAAGASCDGAEDCRSGYCSVQHLCGKGGVGTPCLVNEDCVSTSCEAAQCAPSRFGLDTDGGTDTSVVTFKARLSASASDPARQWRDLALLYFFTAEAHDNFVSRYYDGPDFAVWDARFLATSVDGTVWAMVWRAAESNTGVIPTTVTTFDYQLRNDPWMTFDLTNDYSFRSGGFGANDKVVVCQRVEGRWVHTQGGAPLSLQAPCSLVADACSPAIPHCDALARTQ